MATSSGHLGQRAGLPGARLHRALAAGRGDDPAGRTARDGPPPVLSAVLARPNYQILGSQFGAGYGAPTPAGRNAAQLAARHDGLLLDHTYTAKAMAGLIEGIRDGTYTHQDRIVFFHTGGLAGFLAPRGHAGL